MSMIEMNLEEELMLRRKLFNDLEPCTLFSCADTSKQIVRKFVVVDKSPGAQNVFAIELTKTNLFKLLNRQPCDSTEIKFEEMFGLNLL